MRPSSARIIARPAERGDRAQCARPFARRLLDQNQRPHQRRGSADRHRNHARASPRCHRLSGPDAGNRLRPRTDARRQGLRQRSRSPRHRATQRRGCHPQHSDAQRYSTLSTKRSMPCATASSVSSIAQKTHAGLPPATINSSRASRPSCCLPAFASGLDLSTRPSQIGKQIEKLTKENKDKINEIGQRLFRDDNFADSAHFTTVLSELRTTPAKVALIAQSLFAGGWPTWVAFLGVCAFSLFILLAATDLFAGFANKLTAQFAFTRELDGGGNSGTLGRLSVCASDVRGRRRFRKRLGDREEAAGGQSDEGANRNGGSSGGTEYGWREGRRREERALALSKIRQRSRTRHDPEVFSFRRFRQQGIREAYWSGDS